MRDTVSVSIKIEVKSLNMVLAMLQQDLVTTDEEAAGYDGNVLDTTTHPELMNDMEAMLGLGGMVLTAKALTDAEKAENKESSETQE